MLKYRINCHTKINLQIIIPNVIKSALGDIYNVTSNISAVTCKTMSTNSSRLKTRHCSAIVTCSHSNYIAHSEPLLKDLNLLSVKDLMDLKLIKFLHKLYHNNLPIYFSNYMPHLEKRETRYNLRSHRLPVPRVTHVYAESCLLYKLVEMKNKLATSYKLIFDKIVNRTHSHSAFSKYVIHIMLESYSYECILNPCRTCGRT